MPRFNDPANLTPRQANIREHYLAGHSPAEIARRLGCSRQNVDQVIKVLRRMLPEVQAQFEWMHNPVAYREGRIVHPRILHHVFQRILRDSGAFSCRRCHRVQPLEQEGKHRKWLCKECNCDISKAWRDAHPEQFKVISERARTSEHYQKWRKEWNAPRFELTCDRCGKTFLATPQQRNRARHGKTVVCSVACRVDIIRGAVTVYDYSRALTCSECGKDFNGNALQHRRVADGKVVVCSVACRYEYTRRRIIAAAEARQARRNAGADPVPAAKARAGIPHDVRFLRNGLLWQPETGLEGAPRQAGVLLARLLHRRCVPGQVPRFRAPPGLRPDTCRASGGLKNYFCDSA